MKSKSNISKIYYKFLAPTTVVYVAIALIGLMNVLLASAFFGQDGTYIVGLIMPITIFSNIVTFFFGVGGCIATSIAKGKGETDKANDIFNLALFGSLFFSFIMIVVVFAFQAPLISLLGSSQDALSDDQIQYMIMQVLSFPVTLFFILLANFVRNDNSPNAAMIGVIISVVLNIIMLVVTIGILDLSISYILFSQMIGNLAGCLFYAYYFIAKKGTLTFTFKCKLKYLKDIFGPGSSGAIIFLCEAILTIVINNFLESQLPTAGIAIYATIKYITSLVFAFYDGINLSAQPMHSVFYGCKDNKSIEDTVKLSFKIMMLFAIFACVAIIVGAFIVLSSQGENMTTALIFLAFTCLFSSIASFLSSYYRAINKTLLSASIVAVNNLALPALFVLILGYGFDIGVTAVWLGILLSNVLTVAVLGGVYRKNILQLGQEVDSERIYKTTITNKEESIVAINGEIEAFCEKWNISMKVQYSILLTIEELVVNIIKHGFNDNKEHYICISIIYEGEDVLVNIRDDAKKFDPTKRVDADVTASAEDRDIGGLGIYLIKKKSKEFKYDRVIGFNNLFIRL